MSKHFKNPKEGNIDNSGFGTNSAEEGGRLTNKDGTTNLRKTGMPVWDRISIYHTLIRMQRGPFLLLVFLFYTSINVIFASIYFINGVEHLIGNDGSQQPWRQFMDAFFFSAQTLTTVGYGHVAPTGMAANTVAAVESLIGILIFALVTGLFYGRFARPRAYLIFSDNVLVAPYKNGRAVMFRVATYKNNHLTDVSAQVTIAMHIIDDGKQVTRFYPLPLEISNVNSLALSWTVVHHLNEKSPLYGFTKQEILDARFELIISMKAFDDHFSNTVLQRTSYTYRELLYGERFLPMFHKADNGDYTILELDKINDHEAALVQEPEINTFA
ncbi:MAG: ion transporter [Taibaiella sp.]|nr:ion transporter [Taibaiella sp.]